MATLTTTQRSQLQRAIDMLVRGSAYETPFDAQVIAQLGKLASSTGFELEGNFNNDCRDRPLSTLLRWIYYLNATSSAGDSFMTGNSVFVDKVLGNDATGARQSPALPFKTLTAAKNAAVSGDTIYVAPGTYAENNLLKNGVNWYLSPGVNLSSFEPGSGAGYGIFDDRSSGACTCVISGDGVLTQTVASGSSNVNFLGVFVVTNASSNITFKGRRIAFATDTGGGPFGTFSVYVTNATNVSVELSEGIIGPNVGSGTDFGGGVYWEQGELYVKMPRIYTDAYYAVWANEPAGVHTGNLWLTVDTIQTVSSNATGIYISAQSPNYRIWANLKELITGDAVGINLTDGTGAGTGTAKLYLYAEKVASLGTNNGSALDLGCQSWINVQKATTASASPVAIVESGTHFINILQYEDAGSATIGLQILGGTPFIVGGRIKILNGVGLSHANGVADISGLKIDTTNTNNAGNYPALVSHAGLILRNCTLLAPAASECVHSAAGQTITNYGSVANKAKSANITVNVSAITVDANVV